jgi:hypothetical protein
MKRKAAGGAWDRLPEEIVSLIAVKVAETSDAPLEDLRSLRLCNKVMKGASSSYAGTNSFNLEHHYQSTDLNPEEYLQTIDCLQGVNNGQALFVKGLVDLCTTWPSGAALLAWEEEEGDLQVSYVLAVIKYYKRDVTDDVFNHIRSVYGEITFGSQVRTQWWMEYKACDEDEACILGVHKWVSDEIRRMMWREQIYPNHL